jgi:peptide/nickel transport system ATP-binding protein
VVRHLCDEVAVMEGGSIKESGPVDSLFDSPRHPYPAALLDAVPRLDRTEERSIVLVGEPSDAAHRAAGCTFHPRCPFGPEVLGTDRLRCREEAPELLGGEHAVACHFPLPAAGGAEPS